MTTGFTPYFIGPVNVGLERDLDSYLIPDDAFVNLDNTYVRRGRIYKKGGCLRLGQDAAGVYQKAGRLGIRTDYLVVRAGSHQTYAANTLSTPVEPGSLVITDGITTFTDNGSGGMPVTAGVGAAGGTINYTTGAYSVTFNALNNGAAVTANYIVKVGNNSPVMGLRTYDLANSIFAGLVAFDLTDAYQFNNTTFLFDNTAFYKSYNGGPSNPVSWTGSNTDFFDSENYQGAMFATNNIPGANFYNITAITQAAAAAVTTSVANNLVAGDQVYFNNVLGMTQINNLSGTVVAPGNPFTVNINSTGFSAYTNNPLSGVVWDMTDTVAGGGDGIRWYDGFTAGLAPLTGWVNFEPPLSDPTVPRPRILQGALLIFAYKDRLVCLNTVEGPSNAASTRYSQRARWSQVGNVYFAPPFPGNPQAAITNTGLEWIDNIPGYGGYRDAPTGQEIVGAELIKDTLVVYFDSSTYKLTFTGDVVNPFIWEKVNTEIGCNSTFSVVLFDRQILSVGANGIYACDSVSMERIDRIIPDEVFTFQTTNNNAKRIQGIRDFYGETVQWTFTDIDENIDSAFPYKTLLFNYTNQTFAIFYNCFTCFGYFNTFNDQTYGNSTGFYSFYNRPYDSFASQGGFPIVVAGNQQGFVFQLQNSDGSKLAYNDHSLIIQSVAAGPPSVFTVINHTLQPFDLVMLDGNVPAPLIGNVYTVVNDGNYTANTFALQDSTGAYVNQGGYVYGGYVIVKDNFLVGTKNLNPYFAEGKSLRLGYADFLLEVPQIPVGQTIPAITVYLYQNDDSINPVEQSQITVANPYITYNTKAWYRVYFQSQGQFLKIALSLADNFLNVPQPDDPAGIAFNATCLDYGLIVHGMIFWMKPTGRDIYVA